MVAPVKGAFWHYDGSITLGKIGAKSGTWTKILTLMKGSERPSHQRSTILQSEKFHIF